MASWSWRSVTTPRSRRIRARIGKRTLCYHPHPHRFKSGSAMALRFNSLKTRTALAVTLVIVFTLVLNAVYLIVTRRREMREQIESEARIFAQLTKAPICVGYDGLYHNTYEKFRELIREAMSLNANVERIQIIDTDGRILFDSGDEDAAPANAPERPVREPDRLAAVKGLE